MACSDGRPARQRCYKRVLDKCPMLREQARIILVNEKDTSTDPLLREKLLSALEAVEEHEGEAVERDLLRPYLQEEG